MQIKGVGVSDGVAIGKAYWFAPCEFQIEHKCCVQGQEQAEQERWENAKKMALDELQNLAEQMSEQPDKAKIFLAQQEFLEDEEIDEMIQEAVLTEQYTAEWAVESAYDQFIAIIAKSKNKLISERAADLADVKQRLLGILTGVRKKDLKHLPPDSIIVAKDLLPSDTAGMDREHVLAIVTEEGGSTSHSAIIAKSYRIPAVLGVCGAMDQIEDGTLVIVDATEGIVVGMPDEETVRKYQEKAKLSAEETKIAESWCNQVAATADGEKIQIGLNIGNNKNLDGFQCCDFVGLLRSEFIYMDSDHLPTEEEQFLIYKDILEKVPDKTVTLRTLDIGGDKTLSYKKLPQEANPFLGCRAVRLCFREPEILHTQLRAAYRASAFGRLQIMFPMIGSMDDWRRARDMANTVQQELQNEGIAYDPALKLGVMIEVPAAVVIADLLAKEAEFASIGTNDLAQYLCAADRMEPAVQEYYQSYSPAFVRVLKHVIGEFTAAGKEISVCGELAGDAKASPLLAGLGLKKYSMAPSSIGKVKYMLSQYTMQECKELAQKACEAQTQAQVLSILESGNQRHKK